MAEIIATLHPENNPNDDLFPNIKKENIPSKAINLSKLSPEVQAKLPKVINTDEILPATKLKYLEIDGITYSIPQRANVTSNIKITGNKNDILSSPHNLLCILNDTNSLAIRVVDKIEGGSEEISTLSQVLPQKLNDACCVTYKDYIYIFGGYVIGTGKVNTIYKFNCISKTFETLSVTLPQVLQNACCEIHGEDIYIFGGDTTSGNTSIRVNTIYKFNCVNETIETLSTTNLPRIISGSCCSIYNDEIYIIGSTGTANNGSDIYLNTIYKFNCISETIENLSVTLPQGLSEACCEIQGENIYIFGGYNGNTSLNTIYKFNCRTETIETLGVTLPKTLYIASSSIFGDNIYIFGGYSQDDSGSQDTIYKFNCSNEMIEILSETLPKKLSRSFSAIYGKDIYIFGGSYENTIFNFLVASELIANNVLIYNANSNYSFDLITGQVTIPIKNIYIGDSNNIAQLANAYLYDDSRSSWVNVNTGQVLTL